MKKALIFIFLLAALISKAQNNSANEKLILGKWEYNVAYDTIAAIDTADFYKPFEQREKVMFFMEIKIKKSTATLSEDSEKYNATWQLKNENELYFFLENKKTLKYIITKLTAHTLEFREPGDTVSAFGYYKK